MYPTRILLADDHALVRAGIRNALEGEASLQIVGEVGDGPGLIQALEDLRPDLLLIDVTMPNFEPVATIHRIRLRYPNMFILVVSAYDDDVYVQGLLRAGVNGYHLKDQPLSDLRLAVERVLTGKRWISSSLVDKLIQPTEAIQPDTPKLSSRQIDILHLLSKGLDNRAIAAKLGLSVKTIETHLTRLYRQLNVQSRLEAANFAHEHPELITRAAKNAAPDNQLLLPQEQQASILIVDDNQRYRQQLRRMVGRIYPQAMIYEAANTQDALHLVQRLSPQLVFVDVVLGDESGIRCTRQIKTQSHHSRVILMSAYPDREFHRLGLEAGAKALLDKKDLDAATLFQIITDAIE
ncbi:MAG: response regulator [Ardenticatenaceae bacterium]|nr:response regulator [Anaerolineales bacterium]MCB8920977.1 response regulator [Ardenticatenaceae bacterium]MCB8991599.1 response regulator [Ardenticatenaceae bacterium]MCB9004228.1 response regulator [Ardenticatenaceae bacterium]